MKHILIYTQIILLFLISCSEDDDYDKASSSNFIEENVLTSIKDFCQMTLSNSKYKAFNENISWKSLEVLKRNKDTLLISIPIENEKDNWSIIITEIDSNKELYLNKVKEHTNNNSYIYTFPYFPDSLGIRYISAIYYENGTPCCIVDSTTVNYDDYSEVILLTTNQYILNSKTGTTRGSEIPPYTPTNPPSTPTYPPGIPDVPKPSPIFPGPSMPDIPMPRPVTPGVPIPYPTFPTVPIQGPVFPGMPPAWPTPPWWKPVPSVIVPLPNPPDYHKTLEVLKIKEIKMAMDKAWENTKKESSVDGGRREQGFWIFYDAVQAKYFVGETRYGNYMKSYKFKATVDLGSRLPKDNGAHIPLTATAVAAFHTHTPVSIYKDPKAVFSRKVGPSKADKDFATLNKVVVLTYDYEGVPTLPIGDPLNVFDIKSNMSIDSPAKIFFYYY